MFRTIVHDRTADAVVRQIEDLILEGVLRAGDRLPPERELAAELNVSRPILRDALKLLEGRGLLRSRHGEGSFVAGITGTVFDRPMVELMRRHPRAVADYLEFRRDVEGLAAAHAAERATAADHAILDRILEAMTAAHQAADPEAEAQLDAEFHTAIIEAAHNIVLLHVMRSSYQLMAEGVFQNRHRLYANPDWRQALLEQHQAIHAAVRAKRPEAAKRAAEAHIRFIEEALRAIGESAAREEVAALRLSKYERMDTRRRAS